jgi:aromatic-amino-acid transaminase
MTFFSHLEPYAGDPILSLNDAFQQDPRPHKINLSIGIYFDDDGRVPVLESVRGAESQMLAEGGVKSYLPMAGQPAMRNAVQELLFGRGSMALAQRRVATVQTVGSSGGLKVGADFIARWLPGSGVWVSDPTWDNHRAMFEGAGVAVHTYPYYDAGSGGLKFDAMCDALRTLPPKSIVLLHACCHNPTGVDLSREQWQALLPIVAERELLPYLDLAYQGYGDGLDADAYVVRLMAERGLSFIVANSFSKSMSVYGERGGALSFACADAAEAERVLGQLQATIRCNYSSPPLHAAGIVARVLGDAALRAKWEAEVAAMRERILTMRQCLHTALAGLLPAHDFSYLLAQRGMFSYTGLSAAQVDRLREAHAVYLVRSGRLCVAGLSTRNVKAVAHAMAAVLDGAAQQPMDKSNS